MERKVFGILFFGMLIFSGFAIAADWDGFADGSGEGIDEKVEIIENAEVPEEPSKESETIPNRDLESVSKESKGGYTEDFYNALWVGAGGLFILIVLIYLILHRPRNRWRK